MDFVRLKWEMHIKYSGVLIKFNQLHLTITKQEQKVQSPPATTALPPYLRWGLFWQPMARLSVQESKQKNPTSCHHMVFYWNFISPDSLNSLLSSPPRPVWCYDATIQSLWLRTVSMVMSSDVIKGGLLQGWMKSGTRCTLPPYIRGGWGRSLWTPLRKWETESPEGWQGMTRGRESSNPFHTIATPFGKERI